MQRYQGLSSREVEESRRLHGDNTITPAAREPLWKQFLKKFTDPLIVILLVAGALSVGISCYEYYTQGHDPKLIFEPVGIFVAILLATGLAFIFELKAEKEFKILNQVNDDEPVQVIREGRPMQIPRKEVVQGDTVTITTGEEIPADGHLLDSTALNIDESTLTGEPMAHKSHRPEDADPDATYPTDRVLRGTKVMEGHGVMLVTAVGDSTEAGKVSRSAQIDSSGKTPLDEQLGRLGKLISVASYIVAAAMMCGRLIFYFLHNDFSIFPFLSALLQSLMLAVTLIVVAVPEGLPMAVTLSLAYSMRRMLQTNNLVRKLHACETMGAATVICTDKTGTLTVNRMQVYRMDIFGNPPEDIVAEGIAVNSTAQLGEEADGRLSVLGNPTEGALLLWLRDRGTDYSQLRPGAKAQAEIPFSTERKYMATEVVQSASGRRILYVKGAPEIVYGLCSESPGVTRSELDALLLEYQGMAMRTLGFAYRVLPQGESGIKDGQLQTRDLIFLGIAAISDPVREDVPQAVKEVLDAGIDVKIVTGDTPGTAREIGRRTGLWHDDTDGTDNIITGTELAALSDDELRKRAPELRIIARARPMDKKRLVEALRSRGEVVAVTGDGTNDAPALKAADVGLSMGDGTSVAKDASDITIIDNSFSSIVRAVMWGRSLYKNIQRFLLFQLTVNVAACLLVMFGSFMGTEPPLTVTQMLWVNLIMDTFGAMALSSLPPSPGVMRDKPRDRRASILTHPMLREIFAVGTIFFLITIILYWIFAHADITSLLQLASLRLGPAGPVTAVEATLIFSVFVWTHFWYMFDVRGFETGQSIFRLPLSGGFKAIVWVIVAGQLFITEIAYEFFNVSPMLHTPDWHFNPEGTLNFVIIVAASSLVVWVRELFRTRGKRQ